MSYDFIRLVYTDSERALYRENQITIMEICKNEEVFQEFFCILCIKTQSYIRRKE